MSSQLNVWPSGILDFLCAKFNGTIPGRPFHNVLPSKILSQYLHRFQKRMSPTDTIFDDLAPKLKKFRDLKRQCRLAKNEGTRSILFPRDKMSVRPYRVCWREWVSSSAIIPPITRQYFHTFKFGVAN